MSQNQAFELELDAESQNKGLLNGESFELNAVEKFSNAFEVDHKGETYQVQLVKADWSDKTLVVRVNGMKHELQVKDQFDLLLDKMGLGAMTVKKVTDVKAPMPGLVLDILVEAGQEVSKGDPLFVLEAMKMENIIKSPADGTVSAVVIEKGQAVEKNTPMIKFA